MFTGSCWLSMCGSLLAFQVDVALDPGAEVVRIARHVVLALARLDAAQAADALGGIDAERPSGAWSSRNPWSGTSRPRARLGSWPARVLARRRSAARRGRCAGAGGGAAELAQELAPGADASVDSVPFHGLFLRLRGRLRSFARSR